jgi:hypothetical protein
MAGRKERDSTPPGRAEGDGRAAEAFLDAMNEHELKMERDSMPLAKRHALRCATEVFLDVMNEREARMNGGEKGIRTLGTVSRTHAFQACSFNHSDISPFDSLRSLTARRSSRIDSLASYRVWAKGRRLTHVALPCG